MNTRFIFEHSKTATNNLLNAINRAENAETIEEAIEILLYYSQSFGAFSIDILTNTYISINNNHEIDESIRQYYLLFYFSRNVYEAMKEYIEWKSEGDTVEVLNHLSKALGFE